MQYWYLIVESNCVDIDFQYVYDTIEKYLTKDEKIPSTEDIEMEFIDSIEYWLSYLYSANDFYEGDNEAFIEDVATDWSKFIKENYGEV